jgi:nitroreductase
MLLAWSQAMKADGRSAQLIRETREKFRKRFITAPVLVLCCVDHRRLYYDRYLDHTRQGFEGLLGHHSLAAAIENFLLAAHALGLSACWYSAPLFCQNEVRKALRIPSKLEPAAILTMGFAKPSVKAKARRDLRSVFFVV